MRIDNSGRTLEKFGKIVFKKTETKEEEKSIQFKGERDTFPKNLFFWFVINKQTLTNTFLCQFWFYLHSAPSESEVFCIKIAPTVNAWISVRGANLEFCFLGEGAGAGYSRGALIREGHLYKKSEFLLFVKNFFKIIARRKSKNTEDKYVA